MSEQNKANYLNSSDYPIGKKFNFDTSKSKKKTGRKFLFRTSILFSIGGLTTIGLVGCSTGNITIDNTWTDASTYIAQRSMSLQFIFSSGTSITVMAGTGWIINANTSAGIYYVATNLHVAAAIGYQNHTITSYGSSGWTTTTYGSITQSLIGYVDPTTYGSQSQAGTSALNMISVPTPTVIYTTGDDTNWTSLYSNQVYGLAPPSDSSLSDSTSALYDLASDFAILRYDFSSLANVSISSSSIGPNVSATYPNTTTDVSNFQTWLSNYASNPTKLLTTNAENVIYTYLYYSMGGFPATESQSNNTNVGTNQNIANVEWRSFSNFTLQSSVESYATAGYQYSNYLSSTADVSSNIPIIYVKDSNTSSTTAYSDGYINGAHGVYLDATSDHGASGSMVVTYIDNEPYVVGIYWGSTTFGANDGSGTQYTYGSADLLYTNNNGTYNNTTLSGYNTALWSYNAIVSNNGSSSTLAYNYAVSA